MGVRRASTAERGYGSDHRLERKRVALVVEAGGAFCVNPRCGGWIAPGSNWHLGHEHLSGGWRGPEHARCNVADRNRRHARRKKNSRAW